MRHLFFLALFSRWIYVILSVLVSLFGHKLGLDIEIQSSQKVVMEIYVALV